jgi:hypothetical protein
MGCILFAFLSWNVTGGGAIGLTLLGFALLAATLDFVAAVVLAFHSAAFVS